MNTPAFFSPPRFARLLRLHVLAHGRAWLAFALVTGVLLALLPIIQLADGEGGVFHTDAQAPIYYLGLLLSGPLFAVRAHGFWLSREAALGYLMQPASVFEKWLLSALLLLAVWPLLYTLVFALVFGVAGAIDYQMALNHYQMRLALGDTLTAPDPARYAGPFIPLWPYDKSASVDAPSSQISLVLAFVMLMGYAASTLVYFRRAPALAALALGIGLFFLTLLFDRSGDQGAQDIILTLWRQPPSVRAALPWTAWAISAMFWLGTPLLLWAASWRALYERDVA